MGKPIVVLGSFNVDLTSRSAGLPVPGQSLMGSSFQMGPGGKGSNQAVAAHRAGGDVAFIGKIGTDMLANYATDFYAAEGMDTSRLFRDSSVGTGCALILVDERTAQNEIVVIPGANLCFTPKDLEACAPLIRSASILLVQLEMNLDAVISAMRLAHEAGVTVVMNPAPAAALPAEVFSLIDVFTPNETEAGSFTGVEITSPDYARAAAEKLHAMGVGKCVITLGAQGVYASDGKRELVLPRIPVQAVDTTGAGDAFNGGLVTALSEGKDFFDAVRFGNAVGALSVTKAGTAPSMPRRDEIDALVAKEYGI